MAQALRDVLPAWACQASCFMAKDGSDRTAKTSEVAAALKQWLADPDCEVSCTEPIKEARVKECLEELYREQLRYGAKHGLLRTTNKCNAVEWLYSPPEDAQLSSAPFVRECRKLIFLCLDAGADRDVARVVAGLTPAKSGAKRPQSVVEVA